MAIVFALLVFALLFAWDYGWRFLLENEMKTETLYKKVGRKYVPASAYWVDDSRMDRLGVGKFRLTYAYAEDGSRYEYDVTPDTAGFVAASMLAKHAMCEMIHEKNKASYTTSAKYTKKQQAIIAEFKQKMIDAGGLLPTWWTHNASYEIADAAIQAVKDYRP